MTLEELGDLNRRIEDEIRRLDVEISQHPPDLIAAAEEFTQNAARKKIQKDSQRVLDALFGDDASLGFDHDIVIPVFSKHGRESFQRRISEMEAKVQGILSKPLQSPEGRQWIESTMAEMLMTGRDDQGGELDARGIIDLFASLKEIHFGPWMAKQASAYLLERKRRLTANSSGGGDSLVLLYRDTCLFLENLSPVLGCEETRICEKFGAVWRALAKQLLDAEWAEATSKLRYIVSKERTSRMWDFMEIASLDRVLTRAFEECIALESRWAKLPSESDRQKLVHDMHELLMQWAFDGFLSIPDLAADDLEQWNALLLRLASINPKVGLAQKLSTTAAVLRMNLLQIGNAYRQNRLCPPLQLSHLAHLVKAMFIESPGRELFLTELAEDAEFPPPPQAHSSDQGDD